MIRKSTKSGYIVRRLSKQNCAFLIHNKRCDIILLISSEACIKIITRPDKMSNQRAFLNAEVVCGFNVLARLAPYSISVCFPIVRHEEVKSMDLLNGNVKTLFFKYFKATISSSMVMTIYSLVDTICIGQYEGSTGTAAIACFFPMYSILFAFGLLFGVGGSVLMAQLRGAGNKEEGDKYFSVGLMASLAVSLVVFVLYNFAGEMLLKMCGASGEILDMALKYMLWIAIFSPLFLVGQYLILFIRNDGAPMWTTIAAICGGAFNIFGDIFFVFGLDMGIEGAGLATAIGEAISFIILALYFVQKRCTLRFSFKNLGIAKKMKKILTMGASNFAVDIAMGVVAVIFNRQIMLYLGPAALGVYGVVSSISTTIQTFGYAVGETAQAIISINFGAGKRDRIMQAVKYAGVTAIVIGLVTCILIELFPLPLVEFYMTTTEEVRAIASGIMRSYFTAMVLLVFNVFSTYYFQAVGRPLTAMIVSLMRGVVVSGILLILLPAIFGGNAIWFAVPIAEASVFIYVAFKMKSSLKLMPENGTA